MAEEVLVATVVRPSRRFRISQKKFDEVNAAAEEAGHDSPFIVQDDDCEGGQSFDQLSKAEQTAVTKAQEKRQSEIDGDEEE